MPLSRDCDCDCDSLQPSFYSSDEWHPWQLPPWQSCSEDMCKKLEPAPTPPLSPSRLEMVSRFPGDDADQPQSLLTLRSIVIRDCMWSGFSAAAEQRGDDLQDLSTAASECIDPSVVFPYPLAETSKRGEHLLDTPPNSSSSGSEDDDADAADVEEDEEDIDVVTVEKRQAEKRREWPSGAAPLVLKRCHVSTRQHNYAAAAPPGKRLKTDAGAGLRPTGVARKWASLSDSSEHAKRRSHNVLERQRRNELKLSFAALRRQIPDVADNHKAAKVLILKKAAERVRTVQADERRLLALKEQLRRRGRSLAHKLSALRQHQLA